MLSFRDAFGFFNRIDGIKQGLIAINSKFNLISAKGVPVIMPVSDPRAFMTHKVWLSNRYDREPVKKQRDLNQARIMLDLLHAYLPHYPLNTDELCYFPKQVVQAALGQLVKFSDEDRRWLEGSPVGDELI